MKYLAVDIGNVLCNVDFNSFIKELSRTLNVSIEDIDYFLNRTQKLHDMGLTSICDELVDHFGIKSKDIVNDLVVEWNRTVRPNPIMISFISNLIHKENVNVALLSNIGIEHSDLMRNLLTKEVFDHSIIFFSCQIGARKPSALYYKTFLDMYPNFNGCVYLDDRIENIEAGKKFGFISKHFVLNSYDNDELKKHLSSIKKLVLH